MGFKICSENARPEISHLPEPLRELVNDCWNMDPKLRPSFPEIVVRLRRLKHLRIDFVNGENVSVSLSDSDMSSAFTSNDSILTSSWKNSRRNSGMLERSIEFLRPQETERFSE